MYFVSRFLIFCTLVVGQELNINNGLLKGSIVDSELYLDLLLKTITGAIYEEMGSCEGPFINGDCDFGNVTPFNGSKRENGEDWPAVGTTMIGTRRMKQFQKAIISVIEENIQGDIVEVGVWRGGACIWARKILDIYGETNRTVHLFDKFEPMTGYENFNYLAVTETRVRRYFELFKADVNPVIFHKGSIEQTAPAFISNSQSTTKIAILRVDCNFYICYQAAMYHLYPLVPVGGYVIFDDILSHEQVTIFWLDFKTDYNLTDEELIGIDRHSVYFRKVKHIVTDINKMKTADEIDKDRYKNIPLVVRYGVFKLH